MKRNLFLFLLWGASALQASTFATTGTQQWQWGDSTIDTLELFIETPGISFINPGISNFSNSWTSSQVNAEYSFAIGTADEGFLYDTHFTGPWDQKITYDYYGYLGGNLVEDGSLTWDGISIWTPGDAILPRNQEYDAAPEPASLALICGGLLAIAGLGSISRKNQGAMPRRSRNGRIEKKSEGELC